MMRTPLAIGLLLAFVPRNASAQEAGTIEFAGFGLWHNKTTPYNSLRGFGIGGRLGIYLPANFEVEGQADLTFPRTFPSGNRFKLAHVAASVLYNVPLASGATFYARVGYGKLLPVSCSIRGAACASFGAVTGAGGIRIPLTGPLYFRAEAMYRTRSTYSYSSFGGSAGLAVFRLKTAATSSSGTARPREPAAAGPDADSDGVPNRRDRCKDTPLGALVNDRGCPTDTDRDGVWDGIDRCPATPLGTQVDDIGCPAKKPD